MQTLKKHFLKPNLPFCFPKKKILAIDVGGTLAKAAFYVPPDDPHLQNKEFTAILSESTIPSKLNKFLHTIVEF